MKSLKFFLMAFAVSLFSFSSYAQCSCTAGANQITNPAFTAGNTGFNSTLPFAPFCQAQSYDVANEARTKCNNSGWQDDLWDHTVGNSTGSYMVIDGWNTNVANEIWTEASTINVVAGQQYTFSFWQVRGISDDGSQTLEMRIGGTVVATFNTNTATRLIWTEYATCWTATSSGPVSVSIWQNGRAADPITGTNYNDYGIDDVTFSECETACEIGVQWVAVDGGCTWDFISNVTTNSVTTIVGYSWTFGDGYSSTDPNPTHTYLGSGAYTVCLTVWGLNENGECCSETYCKSIEVQCKGEDCRAEIERIIPSYPNPLVGNCGIKLTAQLGYVNRPIVGYFWDFGDGSTGTSTDNCIVHQFPASGVYNVCVTVILMDAEGRCCTFRYCEEVEIECRKCTEESGRMINDTPKDVTPTFEGSPQVAPSELGVFPNPGKNELRVMLDTEEATNAQITLIDLEGRQVMSRTINIGGGSMATLDVSDLPAGIFMVQVRTANGQYTDKWIKQ